MKTERKVWNRLWIVFVALALCVPAAVAQQQKDPRVSPAGPVPAIMPAESSSTGVSSGTQPAPVPAPRQESTPLTSAQDWSLAGIGTGRNLLLSSLSLDLRGDTRPDLGNSGRRLTAATTIGGQLTFQRVQAQNEFVAEYQGGGTFYASGGNHMRSQQDFRVSYKRIGRAWAFLLSDAVNYSPEGGGRNGLGFSQLGTGVSAGGNSFVNLNSQFLPNQSITATNSPRVSNTILAEFQKTLGRRSAMTFSGSYGILRFLEDGFIDGNTISFRAGYNYTPTARDTIGFLYGGNLFRFNGTAQENLSHTIHISYGRQITGRLSLQMGAGPQVTMFDTILGTRESRVSWSMNNTLRYRLARTGLSLSYIHGVTGGSGVFLGAQTDDVNASISYQLSRVWRARLGVGYAHNESLRELSTGTTARRFNTWRGDMELSRPVGRYARMYLRYGVERQTSTTTCTTGNCPLFGTRQLFGLGFTFRFREIELE